MPSLFKRRSVEAAEQDSVAEVESEVVRPRGYTPSKRELGKQTPKRSGDTRRKVEPPPANRKEALKRSREKARQDREERRAGMLAGDERYLLPRDRGPERALVRDIVDKRYTVGTFFFGGALIVLIGSGQYMPPVVQIVSNALWALLAVATVGDSVLLSMETKRRIRERFPKTDQRMPSLYAYAIMRGLTFRRMRMPKPRVKIGEKI